MLIKDLLEMNKNKETLMLQTKKRSLSYFEFYHIVQQKKNKLRQLESLSNSVMLYLPNSIEYAIAYFTVTYLDKVIVPVSNLAKKDEIVGTVDYCEISLIITNHENLEYLKQSLSKYKYKIMLYCIDEDILIDTGNKQYRDYKKDKYLEDVAIMLHTSGTTSNPKRVMLTHKNLISNIRSNILSLNFTKNDKTLIALPMYFGYCNTAQFLTHIYVGASIYILDNIFMPHKFYQTVDKEKITNFTGVPSMLLTLLNYKNIKKHDVSSLRCICFGGGNMPIEKLEQLISVFHHTGFVQTYGQTEASPRVTALLPEDAVRKLGSVGKAIPGVLCKIIDENKNVVKKNIIGEIIVKGDNVMKGYYKRPEITKETLINGWLYTGDLAKYDEEGYIYLTGRKKNVIISGGINIYPEEVEEVILNHEAVKETLVYGIKHKIMDEVPAAKVVLYDEYKGKLSEDDIINYCIEKLSRYKVPVKVIFMTKLNKTVTNKVKRY
ncbi:class I adenylate-forming enzyme family protein [Vallitalea sp.]|jgi:long-chain acyl-CoA synthetase|uniref:class I adenylate-forming enzyme family protein n=1 Tax=Vallitalea sp. TaxID=1882829 RepID=UPI0025CFE149|nr:class I adenylate-forming enzyme family protein [Vallitalea sp.]MCT4686729.1 acyl--CoA ligase [Vallitalea sp.]